MLGSYLERADSVSRAVAEDLKVLVLLHHGKPALGRCTPRCGFSAGRIGRTRLAIIQPPIHKLGRVGRHLDVQIGESKSAHQFLAVVLSSSKLHGCPVSKPRIPPSLYSFSFHPLVIGVGATRFDAPK